MAMMGALGGLASAGIGMASANSQANAQQAAANYEAAQLREEAKSKVASAQRDMLNQYEQGVVARGEMQARTAAGGSGTPDTSGDLLDILKGIAGRTETAAATKYGTGKAEADTLYKQANGKAFGGAVQAAATRQAGMGSAVGSIFGSFGKLTGSLGNSSGGASDMGFGSLMSGFG